MLVVVISPRPIPERSEQVGALGPNPKPAALHGLVEHLSPKEHAVARFVCGADREWQLSRPEAQGLLESAR